MTFRSKADGSASRLLCNCLAIACLGLGLTWFGCGSSESPPQSVTETPSEDPSEKPPAESPAAEQPTPSGPAVGQQPATAESVLDSMVAAYKKASSYADAGLVRLLIEQGEEKIDESAAFSLTLVRPNKVRMQIYQAMVVSDGEQLHAAIEDLPGQVLSKPSPDELTLESIYADRLLQSVLSSGLTGAAPQSLLLLADDPLSLLLQNAEETVLGKPGTVTGRDCYRVEIKEVSGTTVYWIDQESYVLRRIVFPTDALRRRIARGGPVGTVSLVAEFEGAQFDGQVDAKAFEFETPAGAELVKFFAPPDPAQLLSKKVPDFKFVDLEGKPVTPESLDGKIAVLEFWYTTCRFCRDTLPSLAQVKQQYKDNEKVVLFAVSVDEPGVKNEELRLALEQLGVDLPIVRDLEGNMGMLFNMTGTPSKFIIDAKGVVQFYEEGVPPIADLAGHLSEQIEKLLAGEDIYQEQLEAYRERLKRYEQWMQGSGDSQSDGQAGTTEIEIPQAEIAQRSEPKTFKLTPLWECSELTAPGNILVVESADGPSQLLIVDAGRAVAEVGLDGKLIATHPLDLEDSELVTNVRTAAGADGKRYVAAVASGQQRFHLLDAEWDLVLSYPQDALENKHSGIADVQLGDLDGDGTLEAYVGYWGVVGVQAVSLQGNRIWSNRSLSNVERMAFSGADPQGRRRLLCAKNSDLLVAIDSDGKRSGEIAVPGRLLHWIVAAELAGGDPPELCILAAAKLGENVAIGVNLQGEELWTYPLPKGVYQLPVEPVVAGRILPGTAGQWLLPGADGSIHVLRADGKPLDSFHYGSALAGLATAELDGEPVLIVSTPATPAAPGTLKAWKVE